MTSTAAIPARFLLLLAHFVLTVAAFWSRDRNVQACLPEVYTAADYTSKHRQLTVALSLTLIFFVVEFGSFFTGTSMFNPSASLLCGLGLGAWGFCFTRIYLSHAIMAHAGGAISMSFFIVDALACGDIWYIWGFCSLIPFIFEATVLFAVHVRKLNY